MTVALTDSQGRILRHLSPGILGFDRVFGLIEQNAREKRMQHRSKAGIKTAASDWAFRFEWDGVRPRALEGCQVQEQNGKFRIATEMGEFGIAEAPLPRANGVVGESDDKEGKIAGAIAVALLALFLLMLPAKREQEAKVVEEPQLVVIPVEQQKTVRVSRPEVLDSKVVPQTKDQQVRRAIQQNLGFLGVLGRKDLSKALGGAPTQLRENASPGAGAGGKQGSGGELLVGLGEGVKRTTVGNTGVAGLGGIGTKGAGGGLGGYGNAVVGSGEGRGLTSMALGKEMELEGGLDRNLINATIAKYISQIRACYEAGLAKNSAIQGTVSVAFEINGGGRLNFARVAKSSLGDAGVESCMTARMMNWNFPKPVGSVAVRVNYPFLLKPSR